MTMMALQDGNEMRRNRLRRRAVAMVSALYPQLRDQAAADQVKRYMDFAEESESDAKHLVNYYYKVAMDALGKSGPAPFKVAPEAPYSFRPNYFRTEYRVDEIPLAPELIPGEPTSHFIARKEKETCP